MTLDTTLRKPFATCAVVTALAVAATAGCGRSHYENSSAGVRRPGDGTGSDASSGTGVGSGGGGAGGTGTGTGAAGTGGAGGAGGTETGSGTRTDTTGGAAPATMLEGFTLTVFPVVRENCKGCHERLQTPFFAAESPEAALRAVQDTGKVNFDTVEDSRLVKRLGTDNHNCWTTCPENAEEMRAAVEAWKTLITSTDPDEPKEETPKLETTALLLAEAEERDQATDPLTLAAEAEGGTLTAPMIVSTNTNASGSSVVSVPAVGGAAQINNAQTQNIGIVRYTLTVKEAGTYGVFGLVNAPTATANRFFVRVDNGAFQTWTITPNGAAFAWTRVTGANAAPFAVQLAPGPHTVEIRRSRPGTNLDMMALSANPNFDGSQAVFGTVKVLRYDLSGLVNAAGAFFEIEMADFNDRAYKFRNPRVVTASAKLRVAGIRILVNGVYDPQHSTFNLVDKTVAAPGEVLSPAAMVVIKDVGTDTDQISFTFDTLEVVP